MVNLLGAHLLAEQPTMLQWGGIGLYLAGVTTYFYPVSLPAGQVAGAAVVMVGVFANAGSALLGRGINREGTLHPLVVTTVTMGIGSLALLAAGITAQGLPSLSPSAWAMIVWLALVNTALAFTLWNHTLRTVSALESSIINNAMMIQIPILAWLFLGEQVSGKEAVGLALAAVGILLVQLRRWPLSDRRAAQPSSGQS